jgi:hypothetical protein
MRQHPSESLRARNEANDVSRGDGVLHADAVGSCMQAR